MQTTGKTVKLQDAGGFIIGVIFLGLPFGTLFDYLWNYLVLSIALPRVVGDPNYASLRFGCGRKLAYCFFITILGIVIDWAYFVLTWDVAFGKTVWSPTMSLPLQLLLLLLPMAMLSLVNFAISFAFLKLEFRQAITLGVVMGIFTAPWLIPTVPYIAGWVR
jgi:hypothetical protein